MGLSTLTCKIQSKRQLRKPLCGLPLCRPAAMGSRYEYWKRSADVLKDGYRRLRQTADLLHFLQQDVAQSNLIFELPLNSH